MCTIKPTLSGRRRAGKHKHTQLSWSLMTFFFSRSYRKTMHCTDSVPTHMHTPCLFVISVNILEGKRYWLLFSRVEWTEQLKAILTLHGKCALEWLPSAPWHLYLTNRLIIGWLNESLLFRIDFRPRQMMCTWHEEIERSAKAQRHSVAPSTPTRLDKFLHPGGVMIPESLKWL